MDRGIKTVEKLRKVKPVGENIDGQKTCRKGPEEKKTLSYEEWEETTGKRVRPWGKDRGKNSRTASRQYSPILKMFYHLSMV